MVGTELAAGEADRRGKKERKRDPLPNRDRGRAAAFCRVPEELSSTGVSSSVGMELGVEG